MIPDLFSKYPIPEKLPDEMEATIKELSQGATKKVYLEKVFHLLGDRHRGHRFNVASHFCLLWKMDLGWLWKRRGYFHCTQLNYLLRVMLVRSDLFTENEVELKWSQVLFLTPHRYLRVRMSQDTYINADLWAYRFGMPLGQYAYGFKSGSLRQVR